MNCTLGPGRGQADQANSLWDQAIRKLPVSDRALINTSNPEKPKILQQILVIVEAQKEACLRKRWKYHKGGEEIVIRDKLDKIITWIQRFKHVGSTIVQFDTAHAALPWAGVLLILQIATNDSQTFGAMIDGVERITNLISRYWVLEEAYLREGPLSTAKEQLQLALIKLYTSILRYLVKSRDYFSSSTTKRFLSSALSTPELGVQRYLEIVSKKAVDVDSCLLIAQTEAHRSNDDRSANILRYLSDLRKPITRTSAQVAELHKQITRQERTRILTWLSKVRSGLQHRLEGINYMHGSGLWFLEKTEFIRWWESSSSTILWLHGIPGCGKTKLIYNTINRLLEDYDASPNPAPVAYFYCSRNPAEPQRSDPSEIVRGLLKQLAISKQGNLKDPVLKIFKERDREAEADGAEVTPLTISEAKDLILELLERDPATIVIDALDECDPVRRHELLSVLDEILNHSPNVVKVIVASRDDGDICGHLAGRPNIYVRADDNRVDIERYIDHSLSKALAGGRILNGRMSDDLKEVVSDTLKAKAHGMFRWVTMQIDNLCDIGRIKIENDVRHEIGQLPQTLWGSYDRIYQRVLNLAPPSQVIAKRIFKWLLCSKKLMNIESLAAAVTFPSERHVLSTHSVIDICCNMVMVDHHGHFRFAHLSVREYLESLETFSLRQCNSVVLQRCLEAYIATTVDWTLHDSLDLIVRPYAMLYWPLHHQNARDAEQNEPPASVAREFVFGDEKDHQQDKSPSGTFTDWLTDIWNTCQYPGDEECDGIMLEKLECAACPQPNPQFFACTFDLVWILDTMKSDGWDAWGSLNYKEDDCISLATKWGNIRALVWLLDGDHVTADAMAEALSVAIEHDRLEAATILLRHKANGFAKPTGKETPLHDATLKGHVDLVRGILEDIEHLDVNVFANSMCLALEISPEQLFPLFWKVCIDLNPDTYLKVLLLIHMIIQTDDPFLHPSDLLEGLHERLVDFVWDSGLPKMNKIRRLSQLLGPRFNDMIVLENNCLAVAHPDDKYESYEDCVPAFCLAFEDESNGLEILDILLSLDTGKALLDSYDGRQLSDLSDEVNLLLTLSSHDNPSTVPILKLLLKHGLDVNITDKKGRTPLMLSTKTENLAILEFFLEAGADVAALDREGRSALVHALKNNNGGAVLILIRKGVDINTPVLHGNTALQITMLDDNHGIINILRKNGARRLGFVLQRASLSIPFLASETCISCVAHLLRFSPVEQDRQSGVDDIFACLASRELDRDVFSDETEATENKVSGSALMFSSDHRMIPNAKSWEDGLTPLQAAICLDDSATIQDLLELPVDVNAVDEQGFTALHYAASSSRGWRWIDTLVGHKASPHVQARNGTTPLHLAAGNRYLSSNWDSRLATPLLSQGLLEAMETSYINIPDANGNTALHVAIMIAHKEMIELLLHFGASPYIKNHDGMSPIELTLSLDLPWPACLLDVGLDVFSDAHQLLFEESVMENDFTDDNIECLISDTELPTNVNDSCDQTVESSEIGNMALWTVNKNPIVLMPRYIVEDLDPHMEAPVTDVDLYNAHDTEQWTPLSGTRTVPLRPVCVKFTN